MVMAFGFLTLQAQESSTPHVAIGDVLYKVGGITKYIRPDRLDATTAGQAYAVVFYVSRDEANKWSGWAVNLDEMESCQMAGSDVESHDDFTFGNDLLSAVDAALKNNDGSTNTANALNAIYHSSFEIDEFVPYNYIQTLGNSWYLPALGQLHFLYAQIPEVNYALTKLKIYVPDVKMISIPDVLGENPLYWSSTSGSSGIEVWQLTADGGSKQNALSFTGRVRAIINFELVNE